MAVLLTGATGFVGRNIARALLDRGDEVVLFAPEPPIAGVAGAQVATGDIRSSADLDHAFAAARIDRVIHAAALTPDAGAEAERPDVIVDVNIGGTVQLMQAARRAGVARVLGLSSAAVYGFAVSDDGWLHEDTTPVQPAALYGVTKWSAERIVHRLGTLYGLETATVRLGACFGINEYATGVRPMLSPHWQCAEAARAGRECVLPRPMLADWIDAEEAASAITALLTLPVLPSMTFNLGGGTVTSVASWCEALVASYPGFAWRIDPAASTVRYGMDRDRSPMDTSRLRATIGTAPFTDNLAARAKRYLAWRDSPDGVALCGP